MALKQAPSRGAVSERDEIINDILSRYDGNNDGSISRSELENLVEDDLSDDASLEAA